MAPTFQLDPSGSYPGHGWRPLRKKDPFQRGWDVYDLQSKLQALGFNTTLDGIFGPQTDMRVRDFQATSAHALVIDGIAGAATQTELAGQVCGRSEWPNRALGQMQQESSLLCGIYTPVYSNGSQDTGPLQRNTLYHPVLAENFDVREALRVWEAQTWAYYSKYVRWGVHPERAWAAAQGAWNNPSNADKYARGLPVPQVFLDYVEAVTAYV